MISRDNGIEHQEHSERILREISAAVGITERATLSILRALEEDGIISRQKEGRGADLAPIMQRDRQPVVIAAAARGVTRTMPSCLFRPTATSRRASRCSGIRRASA
jgi:predicted ArsR family transcriptional regulator